MRRATAWLVVVGVACLGTPGSASADSSTSANGFWVSIASGAADSATATGYQEVWFETPHGPPPVAVTQASGATIAATTGGGSSFFSGGAVPVVLPTTDGYGYLSGGPKPNDLSNALRRQTSGGQGLATAAPDATATAPPENAVLLTASLGDPNANGTRTLTVGLTDGLLNPIGTGPLTVDVPDGGWWVVGLGPGGGGGGTTDPDPDPNPDPDPDPDPGTDPTPTPGGSGDPVTTPEPATGVLFGLGGLGAAGWRLAKRRHTK